MQHICRLLDSIVKQFPNDHLTIVSECGSQIYKYPWASHVSIIPIETCRIPEISRLNAATNLIPQICKRVNADIVWALNLGMYRKISTPQVISINNAFQVYPWRDLFSCVARNHFALAALRFFSTQSLKASNGVLVQTSAMKFQVEKNLKSSNLPVRVISKPLTKTTFNKASPELEAVPPARRSSVAFTFLYVATAEKHKNHRILTKAVEELKTEGLNVRVLFTISKNELVRITGRAGARLLASGNVVTLGWVPPDQLEALYGQADACVMPSLIESQSSAHIEAFSFGKPQVCSDLYYAREICGNAALYADPYDGNEWSRQMKNIITNANIRNELSSRGKEVLRSLPNSWESVARETRQFLKTIATERRVR